MGDGGYSVSVTGATYERLRAHSRQVGVPMRWLVGELADQLASLTAEQVAQLVERVRSGPGPGRPTAVGRPRRVSDEAVTAIRAARKGGRKLLAIAVEHGISVAHVSRIASGVSR